MLKVHFRDGRTLEVDLGDKRQAQEWHRNFKNPRFQNQMTGLTVVCLGVQYSVPKPVGFGESVLFAEAFSAGKGGHRLVCHADDSQVNVAIHNGQRAASFKLIKRRRWSFPSKEIK